MNDKAASRMTEYDDRREWNLFDFALTQIVFDPYQITLLISAMPDVDLGNMTGDEASVLNEFLCSSAQFVVEAPLTLRKGNEGATLNPALQFTCVPLLALMLEPVSRAAAYRDSRVSLTFGNGVEITVYNNILPYELWNSHGQGALSDMNMLARNGECPWGG